QIVLLVAAGAAVVAALLLIAIRNEAAVDQAGAPLWRSPGEAYRVCSLCGQRHADLETPRCMRCKTPFFVEQPADESLVVETRQVEKK
ncbi:MAG: hypothetical protein IT428_22675, partial [Planctomycetaceae bacterium]|nr:hypothetical protein [Planctomycetaceae bacterium]